MVKDTSNSICINDLKEVYGEIERLLKIVQIKIVFA